MGFNIKAARAKQAAIEQKAAERSAKSTERKTKPKTAAKRPAQKAEKQVRREYDQVEWRFIDNMMPRRTADSILYMMPQDGDDSADAHKVAPLYLPEHTGKERLFENVNAETAAEMRLVGAEQTEKLMAEFLEQEAARQAKAAESVQGSTTYAYEVVPMDEEQRAWLNDQINYWTNEIEIQLKSKLRVAEAKLHAARDMHDEMHDAEGQEYIFELGLEIGVPATEMKKHCPCVTATRRVRRLTATIKRLSKLVHAARERLLVEQPYTWTSPAGARVEERGPDAAEVERLEWSWRLGLSHRPGDQEFKVKAAKTKQTTRWEVKLHDDEMGVPRATYIKVEKGPQVVRRRILVGAPMTEETVEQLKDEGRKAQRKDERKQEKAPVKPKFKLRFGGSK